MSSDARAARAALHGQGPVAVTTSRGHLPPRGEAGGTRWRDPRRREHLGDPDHGRPLQGRFAEFVHQALDGQPHARVVTQSRRDCRGAGAVAHRIRRKRLAGPARGADSSGAGCAVPGRSGLGVRKFPKPEESGRSLVGRCCQPRFHPHRAWVRIADGRGTTATMIADYFVAERGERPGSILAST